MPRNLKRYVGRKELHFITFSCYQRRALLRSSRVKQRFIKILAETRKRYGFRLIGSVVMPEHVHMLIGECRRATPAKVIQVLKQRVARAMRGKRRAVRGQLRLRFPEDGVGLRRFWQRRYYDFNVRSKEKLREKLDYMHANPVKRGLVVHPRDWPWSSCSFYEQGEGPLRMDNAFREREEEEPTLCKKRKG
jgi:putative transposase